MQAVYTKLVAWMDALTPAGCTVFIRDQNAPTPARPFVTIKARAARDIARDFAQHVDEEGLLDVVRFVSVTCDVQVYGASILQAESIAQGILDNVYDASNRLDYLGRDLAFNLVLSDPQTVDAVIGSEFEPRVVMALGLSASRDIVYNVGAIETVIWQGDVDGEIIGDTVVGPVFDET